MISRLTIVLTAGLGLVVTPAYAQSADDVVQVLTSDTGNLGADVAEYCRQTDEADRETQIAVGAGFALAYQYFFEIGDRPSASTIGQIACTCERTQGEILSSYLASLGELEDEACSTMWQADSGNASPTKFRFSPTGGPVSGH